MREAEISSKTFKKYRNIHPRIIENNEQIVCLEQVMQNDATHGGEMPRTCSRRRICLGALIIRLRFPTVTQRHAEERNKRRGAGRGSRQGETQGVHVTTSKAKRRYGRLLSRDYSSIKFQGTSTHIYHDAVRGVRHLTSTNINQNSAMNK